MSDFDFFELPALGSPDAKTEPSGTWDSIHVFEASERGRQAHYKLTSTIMLSMINRGVKSTSGAEKEKIDVKRENETTLSGSMTRQVGLTFRHPDDWCEKKRC